MNSARGTAVLDGLCFLVLPALLLSVSGVGFISGDALAQAELLKVGWRINPNHLLLEPMGAAWLSLTRMAGLRMEPPDALARLSILCGCLSLVLFRTILAPRLTDRRSFANGGTIVFALLSGFDRLWISGEAHMLQMPFLVLHLTGVLALYGGDPRTRQATALAIVGGVGAVLAYISNGLVIAGITFALVAAADARAQRLLLTSLLAASGISIGLMAFCWGVGRNEVAFLPWLTSYAGGATVSREVMGYGIEWSMVGLASASARSAFGLVSTIVDLAPVTDVLRRGTGSLLIAMLHLGGCAIGVMLVGAVVRMARASEATAIRTALLCLVGAGIPIWVFGTYWNNSDDQFYFQIAPTLSLVAVVGLAGSSRLRIVIAMLTIPLAVNARDFALNYVRYPREERLKQLSEATSGASLIVALGRDEVSHLMYFIPSSETRVLYLSRLAETMSSEDGLRVLHDTVSSVLLGGGRVATINLEAPDSMRQPWPILRQMDYPWSEVAAAIGWHRVVGRIQVAPSISVAILSN